MLNLIVISGRKQSPVGSWTGTRELEELLRIQFAEWNQCCVRVSHYRHNENFGNVASDLVNLRRKYKTEPFYTAVFAFSWGGGEGLPSLAKHMKPYGLHIDVAVTSDAIYRHFFYAGNWRVLWPKARILMPDNVLKLIPFAQKQSIPCGRGIATTQLQEPMVYLPYNHVEMDSAPEWHDKCLEVAKELCYIAVPSKKYIPEGAPSPEDTKRRALESSIAPDKNSS